MEDQSDRCGETSINPDAEYVEQVRRSIARYDRWRFALFVFYAVMTAVLVALVVASVDIINRLGNGPGGGIANGPVMLWGFTFGISLGSTVGFLVVKIIGGLVKLIID